jgi:hypothetical protein
VAGEWGEWRTATTAEEEATNTDIFLCEMRFVVVVVVVGHLLFLIVLIK